MVSNAKNAKPQVPTAFQMPTTRWHASLCFATHLPVSPENVAALVAHREELSMAMGQELRRGAAGPGTH